MKVWLIEKSDYDWHSILGIFSTEELATKAMQVLIEKHDLKKFGGWWRESMNFGPDYSIVEYELDKELE